jgi:hypothetical protein
MEVKHDYKISQKLHIFTPENAYNHKIWISIYRLMHNMLDFDSKKLFFDKLKILNFLQANFQLPLFAASASVI